MKRNLTLIITAITALLILSPAALNAQEEKEKEIEKKIEKKIKIITVDESGEKTILDTTITGDSDIEDIHLGKGMKWIVEDDGDPGGIKTKEGNIIIVTGDDKETFSIFTKGDKKVIGEEGSVYVMRKGGKDSYSIISIGEESEDDKKEIKIQIDENIIYSKDGNIIKKSSGSEGHGYILKVDEDGEKKLEWLEQSVHLKDGQVHIVIHSNSEVEDLIIDGDAVITIKDGKVKVDSDGLKMNVKEEGEAKEIKGKKIKKEK